MLLVQVGFFVLGWGVVAAAIGVLVLEVATERVTPGGLASAAFGAWFAWALIPPWGRWNDPGPALDRSSAPRLFQVLDDVARQAGVRPPHDVYLVRDVNASIGRRWAGLRRRRYLTIGLPLFEVLSVSELRAVLAHEFGHQHQGDLRLGPFIHGSRAAIASSLAKMDDDGVGLHLFFNWYGRMYVRMSQEISRQQEFHADAFSARVAGAGPAAGALRRIEDVAGPWLGFWTQELYPALDRGLLPPIFEGFGRYLQAPGVVEWREKQAAEAATEADPYDSHPTLAERLDALGSDAAEGAERAPARALLEGAERIFLDHIAVAGARFEEVRWEDIGECYWLPRWREELRPHQHALAPLKREGLAEAVRDIDAWLPRLRGSGPNVLSEGARRKRARGLLATWFAVHLADGGFRIEALPGCPVCAVREDVVVKPFKLVDELVEDPSAWPAELG